MLENFKIEWRRARKSCQRKRKSDSDVSRHVLTGYYMFQQVRGTWRKWKCCKTGGQADRRTHVQRTRPTLTKNNIDIHIDLTQENEFWDNASKLIFPRWESHFENDVALNFCDVARTCDDVRPYAVRLNCPNPRAALIADNNRSLLVNYNVPETVF